MRNWNHWSWWALSLIVIAAGCSKPQEPAQEAPEPAAAPAIGEHDLVLPPEPGETAANEKSQKTATEEKPAASKEAAERAKPAAEKKPTAAEKTAASEKPAARPAEPLKMPEVIMTEALAATCKVKVGDPMPDGELPDLDGKKQTLKSLYGSKLTVVVLWKADDPYSEQELQDLQVEVLDPMGSKGIKVIGVNEKDATEAIRKKLESTGAKFPQLLDSDGAYLGKVATEKLPRTYLLNSDGKILWLDLEYSSSTRRNLLQAIQVALGKS